MFGYSYKALLFAVAVALPWGASSEARQAASSHEPANIVGSWRAQLGDAPTAIGFDLEIEAMASQPGELHAVIINGEERIDVPRLAWVDQGWVLEMPHYDSAIRFQRAASGELVGTWKKRRSKDLFGEMPFLARQVPAARTNDSQKKTSTDSDIAKRWAIQFASSPDLAVGVFESGMGSQSNAIRGTILTTTGDYRYLAGRFSENHLELSCFDGAHAFLLKGERDAATGRMSGIFYSGNWHREAWSGWVDAKLELPDPFQITSSRDVQWNEVSLPDVEGKVVSLADSRWMGRPRIVEIFGSWCPNCHDAAPLLSELRREFQSQGLEVIGLACELTGDPSHDALQVQRYVDRYQIEYPVLILGESDKAKVSSVLPWIDRLRAYPTFAFVDRRNRIQAIYTGFSGPATGESHQRLREAFLRWTEKIVGVQE